MWGVLISAGMYLLNWLLPKLLAVGGTVAVSMTVITPILTYLQNQVMLRVNGMPAEALHFLQFCGVPEAISIVFAAYAMALSLRAAEIAFARSGAQ
jgi:hypothetical protein